MKVNDVALDLWRQILERDLSAPEATRWDPDFDVAAHYARLEAAWRAAGWSAVEIEQRLAIERAELAAAPQSSPGVNPAAEVFLARLCADVEQAMQRLGLDSYKRTARGIEPRVDATATKINVVMTDQSIITVGSFFFRFCGILAKAFTRTLHLAPYFWESPRCTADTARQLIRQHPALLRYWIELYASFAVTGTQALVPFVPATPTEIVLIEQVAQAMETFAIAHEYGHHHLDHGRALDVDALAEEFAADQFALRISYEIERTSIRPVNPYLASGAGGMILILALDLLREIRHALPRGPAPLSDLHPVTDARLSPFDSVSLLKPAEFAVLRNFRSVSHMIMSSVAAEVRPVMQEITPRLTTLTRMIWTAADQPSAED